jgi:hypothetical protein
MRDQFNGLKDLIDAVPTITDLELMRAKMNELITALRR